MQRYSQFKVMDRLTALLNFVAQTPSDPFLHFGIAMEYLSLNNEIKALEKMEFIFQNFPNYLPNYYQLAHLYENIQENDKAIDVYEKGIALALTQNEAKTAGELRSALEELTF